MILIVILLLILAGVGALWWFFRNDLGTRPAAKNYGTTVVRRHGGKLPGQRPGETPRRGGLPGLAPGWTARWSMRRALSPAPGENAVPAVLTRFATASNLDQATAGNTVLECTGDSYASLAQEDVIKENSGFTLYLQSGTYRFKVVAVYYLDPAEEGEGAFDLYGSTDLSNYYDYLSFVAGIQARSLWQTNVEFGDDSPLPDADQHHQ